MYKLSAISEDTTAFPWAKRTPTSGVLAVIAVGVALLLGGVTGHRSAGAIAAGSAFTVGFAVYHEALSSTLLSMAVLTLGIASATLAGSAGAPWTALALLMAMAAAVNYGLLAGVGPTEGWIGQQCGVFVVVASYFANGPQYALGRTGMVLAGGALQMLIFSVSYGVRHLFCGNPTVRLEPVHRRLPARIRELLDCIERELTMRGDTAQYVARLAIVLLVSTVFYRLLHLSNGYWIPMTALLVLKPQWAGTLSRGIARMAGTVVGAGAALILAKLLPYPAWFIPVMVLVSAWACYALQAVNYAVFSVFITLYIVFLFRFGGFSETAAAHMRLVNTVIGGALAVALDATWKVWLSRRHTSEAAQSVQ